MSRFRLGWMLATLLVLASVLLFQWLESRRWQAIRIHQSGSEQLTSAIHTPCHYLIGNGVDNRLGQIIDNSAHVPPAATAGTLHICLIGNFNQHGVPELQYLALLDKVRELMDAYDIPLPKVQGHASAERTALDDCPGRFFPQARLHMELLSGHE